MDLRLIHELIKKKKNKTHNTKLLQNQELAYNYLIFFIPFHYMERLRTDIKENQSKKEEKEHSLETKRGWSRLGYQTRVETNLN